MPTADHLDRLIFATAMVTLVISLITW